MNEVQFDVTYAAELKGIVTGLDGRLDDLAHDVGVAACRRFREGNDHINDDALERGARDRRLGKRYACGTLVCPLTNAACADQLLSGRGFGQHDPGAAGAVDLVLRGEGWLVLQARTGAEAIAHLGAAERVDVVFTDIQLPGRLSGWDVADACRSSRRDMPVIYTSGNAADRRRAVGGSHFFEKPYDAVSVVRACRQCA
jgi:CheY-like chemotaxis protein